MIDKLKPLLETYAYNILGSREDARDVVQDIYVKVLGNRIPVAGRQRAVKYLLGVYEKYQKTNRFVPAVINHQPAFLHYQEGELVSCQVFSADENGVQAIYFIRNPEKLKNI